MTQYNIHIAAIGINIVVLMQIIIIITVNYNIKKNIF